MEQSVARRAHNPKVTGSSPVPATNVRSADVAQSVERILGKDKVTSSILVVGSTLLYSREHISREVIMAKEKFLELW